MKDIIAAAESKFGEVKAIKESKRGGYVLLISRETPVFYERPYMTIQTYTPSAGGVAFEHGHYDLGWNDAQADYESRK